MTLQKLDTHQDQVDQKLVWVVPQVITHVPGKVNLDNMTFLLLAPYGALYLTPPGELHPIHPPTYSTTVLQCFYKKVCSKTYMYTLF